MRISDSGRLYGGEREIALVVHLRQRAGEQHLSVKIGVLRAPDRIVIERLDRLLPLIERLAHAPLDMVGGNLQAALLERRAHAVDAQEMGDVGDPLRVVDQVLERLEVDLQLEPLEPGDDDAADLVGRHRGHVDLHQRPLDRLVLANEFVDGVGHADDQDRRVDRVIGERLDRVRHGRDRLGAPDPVEFVEDHDQGRGARQLLQRPPHPVGRLRIEVGAGRRRGRKRVAHGAEADVRLPPRRLDVLERLGPQRGVAVRNVAVRSRHDEGLALGEKGGNHVGERRLARPALAVQDRMAAALGHRVDDLEDLILPAGEEIALVDRGSGREHGPGLIDQGVVIRFHAALKANAQRFPSGGVRKRPHERGAKMRLPGNSVKPAPPADRPSGLRIRPRRVPLMARTRTENCQPWNFGGPLSQPKGKAIAVKRAGRQNDR